MPLKVSGVSRRFNQKWVLKDVSFELENGRILGIFGPTGSGKSALLRVLAGKDRNFTGACTFNESEDDSGRERASRTLVTGENPKGGFLSRLGLISANQLPHGAAVSSLLEDALSSRADLVLMDNPLCNLDVEGRARLLNKIREQREGSVITVVLASPNFDDILQFCDEAVVLDNGEILQTGTPEQIYLQPATAEVARITGRNNIFEARRLTSSNSEVPEFQTIQGSHRLTVKKTEKARLGPLNQNMLLSIRPEHISISFGASFPEDNLLKASITRIKFLGPNTLVELDAGGLRISAFVARLVGLKQGDDCMLGMPPDRITVYTA